MLKSIKISASLDKVFAISDLHYNHNKEFLYGPRGFKNIQDHNAEIVKRWNETCDEASHVFHLGDLLLNSVEADFWELMRRLRFRTLYSLWGNHNASIKDAYRKTLKEQFPDAFPDSYALEANANSAFHYEIYPLSVNLDGDPSKTIIFLPEYVEASIGGKHWVFCHYPISSWNHMSKGSYMVFGHCHNSLKEKLPFRLDVGVEAFGRPISLAEIVRLTAGQEVAKVDHH